MQNTIKISFISLGCDKNLVDSEIMLGLIDSEGYTITPLEEDADIIIINTCGFIMDATEEGIENILRAASYKTEGRCKGLIVTGCMAQRYRGEIFKELPEVDAVVGAGDFERIGEVIKEVLAGAKKTLISDKPAALLEENAYKRILTTSGHFAYLKIAEGCDNFCTYCTIPSIRGKYRSRSLESLVKEAEILSEKGVKELILVAQDTTLYGGDLYAKPCLPELIERLSGIDGIEWIRLMYAYPENITEDIIKAMATHQKVCHYVDMPLQHASDRILKLMGRRGTSEEIRDVIARLRTAMPDIAIRTTFITGFPGETEEDFQILCGFAEEIAFDRLGVFCYSREEGTPAYDMPEQIDEEVKAERQERLMEIQKAISAKKNEKLVGQVLQVITEGKLPEEDVYMGRSYRDCYEVDGLVFFRHEEELLAGDFVNVKITEASDYDLTGLVAREKRPRCSPMQPRLVVNAQSRVYCSPMQPRGDTDESC